MTDTTVSSNGVHNAADEAIDVLYAWMPPLQAPQPCPEALFSMTLRGTLDGIETLLTVRGMTASEFQANLAAVRGLLDAVPRNSDRPPQASSQEGGWCQIHNTALRLNHGKDGRTWYSHRLPEGGFCKGR
jgi:hypothetical protein